MVVIEIFILRHAQRYNINDIKGTRNDVQSMNYVEKKKVPYIVIIHPA